MNIDDRPTIDNWPRDTFTHFGNFQMTISLQLVIQLAPCRTTCHPTHSVFGSRMGFWRMADGTRHFRLDQIQDRGRVMAIWIMYICKVLTRSSDMANWSFFSRWPLAAILDLIKPDITPFDPPSWKTAVRWNSKWRPFWRKTLS